MKRLTHFEKAVLRTIGEFYLAKNNNDFEKCHAELKKTGITNIEVSDNELTKLVLTISVERPSFLIGVKCENIDKLKELLGAVYKKEFTIKIHEDRVYRYLFPIDY